MHKGFYGDTVMRKKAKFEHPRLLNSIRMEPVISPEIGDEVYCNGAFYYNITALLEWLKKNPQPIINVPADIWGHFDNKEECYVDEADFSRPIIIAEIAPDYKDFVPDISECDWIRRGYVCIDGQHRIEKARKFGLDTLPAVILRMEQHIPYIYKGYEHYVDYWNLKLKSHTEYLLLRSKT